MLLTEDRDDPQSTNTITEHLAHNNHMFKYEPQYLTGRLSISLLETPSFPSLQQSSSEKVRYLCGIFDVIQIKSPSHAVHRIHATESPPASTNALPQTLILFERNKSLTFVVKT